MKFFNFILLTTTLCITYMFVYPAGATEDYSDKTGKECNVCHIDPMGGGGLTEFGSGYLICVSPETNQSSGKQNILSKIIRLVIFYIHIITAFLWFGTILYVHLVLKPGYASKGLPGAEVKVGLISMIIMAVTGIVLTVYKISSVGQLLSSKFGILLMSKIVIFSIMVISAFFVIFVIGPKLKNKKVVQSDLTGSLTIGELANFDGEDGRPAYFAYRNKIYDVSNSPLWRNGAHMKRHRAGEDLTGFLSQAPHDESKILSMRQVGELSELNSKPKEDVIIKVFYFIAYMNLAFVFAVSFILALWRW